MVTAFLPFNNEQHSKETIKNLMQCSSIDTIYLLSPNDEIGEYENCEVLKIDSLFSIGTIKLIEQKTKTDFVLFISEDTLIQLSQFAVERIMDVAEMTSSGIVYSDYYEIKNNKRTTHPVIDYQVGSIRDDFNFGPVLFIRKTAIANALKENPSEYNHAAVYDLRLSISQSFSITHVPEYLYSIIEHDDRKSGEKIFDYVNPRNREVQIEMEIAATSHLKNIGAYLEPKFESINENEEEFPFEASVIIPVRNRVKTIKDAVDSALIQKTNFTFNIIVVDNHSNDGTTEILKSLSEKNKNVVHLIPQSEDLGIGGCWNEAVHSVHCGKYSCQLDSDDVYSNEDTLQKIVDVFKKKNAQW